MSIGLSPEEVLSLAHDPIKFISLCWPDDVLYDRQEEVLMSLVENDETVVRAGNMLGKDWLAGKACVWFFCTRVPVRIVTTSVDSDQLEGVLWGEIRRCMQTSRIPLPIHYNHLHIRWKENQDNEPLRLDPISYLLGRVAQQGEGMQGHHCRPDSLPRTLAVFDEASGIDDETYQMCLGWASRILIIGNPKPCTNFFFRNANGASVYSEDGKRKYRNVIHIGAKDSPNYRLGLEEIKRGLPPSDRMVVPGVITYSEAEKRYKLFDPVHAQWSLDGIFPEDASSLLYPPKWMERAGDVAEKNKTKQRIPVVMGIDPAMGGDDTVWTIIDELGIIEQVTKKTPNTADIPNMTLGLMRKHNLKPENIFFDLGGGGQVHVDTLRGQGYQVRGVGFNETVKPEQKKRVGMGMVQKRKRAEAEEKYVFKNRRAEMYGLLREAIDPKSMTIVDKEGKEREIHTGKGFGIPKELTDLRQQMAPLPLMYDGEGRLYLPPKDKPTPNSTVVTIREMLGRSPDHADSLVLAVYGLKNQYKKRLLGSM